MILIRNIVEKKKCVMVFGLKEEVQLISHIRERQEGNVVDKVVKEVKLEDGRIIYDTEKVTRTGRVCGGSKEANFDQI